jgi:hypothetical protein
LIVIFTQVRRETGKEQVVQVHCDEGVAARIGPKPCAGIREDVGEASAGEREGQPLSRDRKLLPGADTVCVVEGNMSKSANVVEEPGMHARSLYGSREVSGLAEGSTGLFVMIHSTALMWSSAMLFSSLPDVSTTICTCLRCRPATIVATIGKRSHVRVMNLDLSDEETTVLLRELNGLIDGDRYFLSPRIKTLKAIRAKIRPEPVREPLSPPPKRYEPPRATPRQRQRGRR